MTRDEFIKIINDNIDDDSKAVIFLEAFDDYVKENDVSEYEKKITEITADRDNILRKYRERFSEGNTVDEPNDSDNTDIIEEKEPEVIDVKELS